MQGLREITSRLSAVSARLFLVKAIFFSAGSPDIPLEVWKAWKLLQPLLLFPFQLSTEKWLKCCSVLCILLEKSQCSRMAMFILHSKILLQCQSQHILLHSLLLHVVLYPTTGHKSEIIFAWWQLGIKHFQYSYGELMGHSPAQKASWSPTNALGLWVTFID